MTPLNDISAEKYALHIQEIVKQLKNESKKAQIENETFLVPPDVAKEKYNGRNGETFYLFPNEAPSQEIIDAYERVKPYFGKGEDSVSFEEHLSHRQMTIMFDGPDLVIKRNREIYIQKLTEESLRETIAFAMEKYDMNYDNAYLYIYPYGEMDFFISESFEILSGKSEHRKESNWITFPLTNTFNYRLIRQKCREYAIQHPLEEANNHMININLDDIIKEALVKSNHKKYDTISEEVDEIIDELIDYQDEAIPNEKVSTQEIPNEKKTSFTSENTSYERPNFVAIDLETATSDRSSICQIGITEVIDGVPQTPKSWLVQPEGNEYDSMNIWIHGITPDDTKDSPLFPEVWKEVLPYLQNKVVVAHNTSFDMYALKDAFDKYNIIYPTFDYFCTLRIAKYIVKGCYSYSLDVVLNHLNIEFETHHKADSDSWGCALLLLKCLETDGGSLDDLEAKYHFHKGKFAPNTFISHLALEKSNGYNDFIKSIQINPDTIDEGNYFFGKTICFTGTCQYGTRKELLKKVAAIGAIPTDSVTTKTDVLVVGQQDYKKVGDSGISGKQKKALQLLEKGKAIEILSETEFLCRI